MSITLVYLNQSGKVSPKIQVNVTAMSDKAVFTAAVNEAIINGRTLEMVDVLQDSDTNQFVNAIILGIGADSKIKAIAGNSVFPTFFQAGRLYQYLVIKNNTNAPITVNAGTTPGGTDLINGQDIAGNGITAVLVNFPAEAITPVYLWSAGWNGCNVNLSTISDSL